MESGLPKERQSGGQVSKRDQPCTLAQLGQQFCAQSHQHLHVPNKIQSHRRPGLTLEPPPFDEGAKSHLRAQRLITTEGKCSRKQSSGIPAHQGMLPGRERRECKHLPKGKDLVEETQRIIKSSQAMNFPWRSGEGTWKGRLGHSHTVSGPGL